MSRLLIATDVRFWELASGSHMRIAAMYRYFVRIGVDVHVVFTTRLTPRDSETIALGFPAMKVHCQPELMEQAREEATARTRGSFAQRVMRRFGLVPKPDPNAEKRPIDFVSTPHQRYIAALCNELKPNFLLVTFIRLANLVDGLHSERRPLTLIDTIDIMHLRAQRYHEAGERHWINITRDEETTLLGEFDLIVAIQPRDAETLRGMLPHKHVLTAMHPTSPVWHEPRESETVRIFYLATKGLPHQKAIAHFLANVWPALHEQYRDRVRLCLGGSVCDLYRVAPPPGTELLGHVDDLQSTYDSIDIVINPVLFGGGLKIKCVEALAHSKPLVTTPVGAEGLEDGIGKAFQLAVDDDEFIVHLGRFIEDFESRRTFANAAYAYAQAHFTEEAAFSELRAALFAEGTC